MQFTFEFVGVGRDGIDIRKYQKNAGVPFPVNELAPLRKSTTIELGDPR